MSEKQINIVTGKIQSGKTTKLFTFTSQNESVDGILTPIVDGKRRIYHISTKTVKDFEVGDNLDGIVSVGRYNFLQSTFDWANDILLESFNKSPQWIIIDEIGKLELKGEGFYKSAKKILKNLGGSEVKLILVIRDYLLLEALEYFNIESDEYSLMEL